MRQVRPNLAVFGLDWAADCPGCGLGMGGGDPSWLSIWIFYSSLRETWPWKPRRSYPAAPRRIGGGPASPTPGRRRPGRGFESRRGDTALSPPPGRDCSIPLAASSRSLRNRMRPMNNLPPPPPGCCVCVGCYSDCGRCLPGLKNSESLNCSGAFCMWRPVRMQGDGGGRLQTVCTTLKTRAGAQCS